MPSAPIFSHIALSCTDQARTEQFYSEHFGFRRARVVPLENNNQIVFLKNDQSVYLELCRADSNSMGIPGAGDGPHCVGIRHLAFQVTDINATIKAMGKAAEISWGPLIFSEFTLGWQTVWLKDPDGNIVEISQGYYDQINEPSSFSYN